MKRLFTLVTAFMALASAYAQKFDIVMEGVPVEEGATIEFPAEKIEVGPISWYEVETGIRLAVKNLTDSKLSGTCVVDILENTAGSTNFSICMAGTCEAFTTSTYTKSFTLGEEEIGGTQYGYRPKTDGVTRTRLTINAGGETRTVIVNTNFGTASVSMLPSDVEKSYTIYDASGRLVKRNAGSIEDLENGLYVLRGIDGTTKKVAIKR